MADTSPAVPTWFSDAIEKVRGDIHALELKLVAVEAVNSTRLDTGQKSFDTLRMQIGEVKAEARAGIASAEAKAEAAIKESSPKGVSMRWLATFLLAAAISAGGIIWGLATLVYDRPTKNEVKEMTATQAADIAEIKNEQAALRGQLQGVSASTAKAASDVAVIRAALVPDDPGPRRKPPGK